VLDVQLKELRVDGPFNRQGRADSLQSQRADHRNIAAVVEWFGDQRARPAGRAREYASLPG
jgi:hypothetical protein